MVTITLEPRENIVYEKPLIEEGIYIGKCKEVKEKLDLEGQPAIDVWNNQVERRTLIWVFEILDKKTKQPIVFNDKPVEMVQYTPYMSRKVGEVNWKNTYRSEKSKAYPIMTALGLNLNPLEKTSFDLDSLVGKEVKLTITDYDRKLAEGGVIKMSIIESVKPLSSSVPVTPVPVNLVKTSSDTMVEEYDLSKVDDETQKKIDEVKKQLEEGLVSQKGYDLMMERLTK